MLAGSATVSDSFDLGDFADKLDGIAQPLVSILGSIASVVAGVAGVVIAGNALGDALSGDDFAYSI